MSLVLLVLHPRRLSDLELNITPAASPPVALSVTACMPTPDKQSPLTVSWRFELSCVGVALAMVVAVEIYSWRQHPHKTIAGGTMQAARRSWMGKHTGSGMLTVNTIRDFMTHEGRSVHSRTRVVVVFAVASYALSISEDLGHSGTVQLR